MTFDQLTIGEVFSFVRDPGPPWCIKVTSDSYRLSGTRDVISLSVGESRERVRLVYNPTRKG